MSKTRAPKKSGRRKRVRAPLRGRWFDKRWTVLAVTLVTVIALGAGLVALRRSAPRRSTTPPVSQALTPGSPSPGTSPTAGVDAASIQATQEATELNRLGRNAEAAELTTYAIARDSSYDQLYVVRGMARRRLQRYEEAAADFGKAIALAPGAWKAYLYRGVVYTDDLGLFDRGIQDFRRVIELDPGNTDAMMNIAVALYKSSRYDEAIRQYSDVILKVPADGRAVYLRGLAYRAKGDLASAYADILKARTLGASVDQRLLDSLSALAGIGR